MPPREDLMLFIDLETTGADRSEDVIEIGIVAVTLPDFKEFDHFSCIIHPSEEKWDKMVPVVVEMHKKSGLLAAIEAGEGVDSVADAQSLALPWLLPILGRNTSHVYVGGSGFDHFDRPFMERDFPLLLRRLTYYSLDAGNHRRSFRRAGIPWLAEYREEDKPHRALDDARLHAREYAFVIDTLKQHPHATGLKDVGSKVG